MDLHLSKSEIELEENPLLLLGKPNLLTVVGFGITEYFSIIR